LLLSPPGWGRCVTRCSNVEGAAPALLAAIQGSDGFLDVSPGTWPPPRLILLERELV
jgi:hypothetical protein